MAASYLPASENAIQPSRIKTWKAYLKAFARVGLRLKKQTHPRKPDACFSLCTADGFVAGIYIPAHLLEQWLSVAQMRHRARRAASQDEATGGIAFEVRGGVLYPISWD